MTSPIGSAWLQAAEVLGIRVTAPFALGDDSGRIDCDALIADFGSALGTVVLPVDSPDRNRLQAAAKDAGYYYSLLADSYDDFDRELFVATLNDWGWKGSPADRPSWCTDEAWGATAP